jgi:hypothetical protein
MGGLEWGVEGQCGHTQIDEVVLVPREPIDPELLCKAKEVVEAAILFHQHDDVLRCVAIRGGGGGETVRVSGVIEDSG